MSIQTTNERRNVREGQAIPGTTSTLLAEVLVQQALVRTIEAPISATLVAVHEAAQVLEVAEPRTHNHYSRVEAIWPADVGTRREYMGRS